MSETLLTTVDLSGETLLIEYEYTRAEPTIGLRATVEISAIYYTSIVTGYKAEILNIISSISPKWVTDLEDKILNKSNLK